MVYEASPVASRDHTTCRSKTSHPAWLLGLTEGLSPTRHGTTRRLRSVKKVVADVGKTDGVLTGDYVKIYPCRSPRKGQTCVVVMTSGIKKKKKDSGKHGI